MTDELENAIEDETEPLELTEAELPKKSKQGKPDPKAKKGKPDPKYLVRHTAPNHAARRLMKKQERAEAKALESWKRRLTRAGIDVEAEIAKKLEQYRRKLGMEIVTTTVTKDAKDAADMKETSDGQDGEAAEEAPEGSEGEEAAG